MLFLANVSKRIITIEYILSISNHEAEIY